MKTRPHPPLRPISRRGISLMETMISLVITAALLTAVGAAYTASARAVVINDQFFRASQTARVSLNQLMAELRQASVVEVHPATLNVIPSSGQAKTYSYDAASRKLTLTVTDTTGVTSVHSLGSNITSLSFGGDESSVAISLTVAAGNNAITLGGSVVPRRMIIYR